MLGQFSVMDDATMNDSVHAMTTDTKNNLLITGDTMGFLNVRFELKSRFTGP